MPPALLELWRSPEFQKVFQLFVWLGSINAGFWILARAVGFLADVMSELFWEDVWSVLAALYNIALALLFSAVLFVSATKGAAPKDLMWREMCGFLLLYLALGAAYVDARTHRLNDATLPGYALGLIGYVVFAAFPVIVSRPELYLLIALMKALADSWIGTGLAAFVVVGVAWNLLRRGLSGMFYHVSPFLWFIGALKHPPIRVRRDG